MFVCNLVKNASIALDPSLHFSMNSGKWFEIVDLVICGSWGHLSKKEKSGSWV